MEDKNITTRYERYWRGMSHHRKSAMLFYFDLSNVSTTYISGSWIYGNWRQHLGVALYKIARMNICGTNNQNISTHLLSILIATNEDIEMLLYSNILHYNIILSHLYSYFYLLWFDVTAQRELFCYLFSLWFH